MVYTYERANEDALRLVARFLLQGRIGVGESAPAHKYERFDHWKLTNVTQTI